MLTLDVSEFSCIEAAKLEVDRFTVVIGPQASGKSVLAKLCHFALDVGINQSALLLQGDNFEKFTHGVKSRFREWFPIGAWGDRKFRIGFNAGNYGLTIARSVSGGRPSDDIRLQFSKEFKNSYNSLFEDFQKSPGAKVREFEREYRLRERISRSFGELLMSDFVAAQAFVPAGRAFFTNLGKTIAVLEESRTLDPTVLRFGRMYAGYRTRGTFHRPPVQDLARALEQDLQSLIGGVIQKDGEREYLTSQDGRRVPLSSLSSGQQELLPIAVVLPWFFQREHGLCYIEEPEAHLFPDAQSRIVKILAALASGTNRLVMTTHSPYVLTQVNNLLKAGALGKRRTLRRRVETLLPKYSWLSPAHTRAYALRNGALEAILDDDGLIDGSYLDGVSGTISDEFDALLAIEGGND